MVGLGGEGQDGRTWGYQGLCMTLKEARSLIGKQSGNVVRNIKIKNKYSVSSNLLSLCLSSVGETSSVKGFMAGVERWRLRRQRHCLF